MNATIITIIPSITIRKRGTIIASTPRRNSSHALNAWKRQKTPTGGGVGGERWIGVGNREARARYREQTDLFEPPD